MTFFHNLHIVLLLIPLACLFIELHQPFCILILYNRRCILIILVLTILWIVYLDQQLITQGIESTLIYSFSFKFFLWLSWLDAVPLMLFNNSLFITDEMYQRTFNNTMTWTSTGGAKVLLRDLKMIINIILLSMF
jgi:hypothetical protein